MGDLRGVSQHDRRPAERAVLLTDWLFAAGHAADLILLVLASEFAVLVAKERWPFRVALFRLLPGALMIVALRCALTDTDWRWIALALAASFPAHLADLILSRPSARKGRDR